MLNFLWWAFLGFVLYRLVLFGLHRIRRLTWVVQDVGTSVRDAIGAEQLTLEAERDAAEAEAEQSAAGPAHLNEAKPAE